MSCRKQKLFFSRCLGRAMFPIILTSVLAAQPRTSSQDSQSPSLQHRTISVAKTATNAAVAVTGVRHLEDDAWLERLEIEVKNISSKPIYFLEIDVTLPDVISTKLDGRPRKLIMPLVFGRRDLMRDGNFATPEDAALKPGETHVFSIDKQYRIQLQNQLADGSVSAADVQRVGILVYSLSYGDGTGFRAPGLRF